MVNAVNFFSKMAIGVWMVMLTLVGIMVFPWGSINWGSIKFANERSVTVSGQSEQKTQNQIANFSAGVSVNNEKREDAIAEMNKKMDELSTSLKNFGIKSDDIQTSNMNINQNQDQYWDSEAQKYKYKPGSWYVSNSLTITLRDVARANSLVDLLSKSGANNIYGPNFTLDKADSDLELKLYGEAMKDATKKAEAMAKNAGARLGVVLNVTEGGTSTSPVYPMMGRAMGGGGGGGDFSIEPGSSTFVRNLTVTFRLE